MKEKEIGCDNCYYSYFDEMAYPCSLCVRGIERSDKWQPNKKTKADRKTEPQTEDLQDWKDRMWAEAVIEPQTDLLITEFPQDGEVNLIGRDKTEAVIMAYDVYKERIVRCRECRKKYSCVTFEGIANEDGFCSLGEAETEDK